MNQQNYRTQVGFKKALYVLITAILIITMASPSMARISSLHFKGVTKHYQKDKTFYSPTLGIVALESGLIYNLRFYGNFAAAYNKELIGPVKDFVNTQQNARGLWDYIANHNSGLFEAIQSGLPTKKEEKQEVVGILQERKVASERWIALENKYPAVWGQIKIYFNSTTREYASDYSKDATWNLVKELFPSTGGTLTAESGRIGNFGKEVVDPEPVAVLLNYAYAVRFNLKTVFLNNGKKELDSKNTVVKKDLARLLANNKEFKYLEVKLQKSIKNILSYIEESIANETKGFYPRYTTEQIILAFFCEKFNTQADIWKLLENLDSDIVNKSSIPSPNTEVLLTPDDLAKITQQANVSDIDDLYALANADIFECIIPYKAQTLPISNGNAKAYYRKGNEQMNETFPDCVEVTLRHIFNLMVYNRTSKRFDLSRIKKYTSNKKVSTQTLKDNIENLEKFYGQQSHTSANSGSFDMRSKWNAVVGDLNGTQQVNKIVYGNTAKKNHDTYEYEIKSGFVNMINVFKKALELDITPIDLSTATLNEKITYIEETLSTLFSTINPNEQESYEFDSENLKEGFNAGKLPDVYGKLVVTVKDAKQQALFSFAIEVVQQHTELKELKVLKRSSVENNYQQTELPSKVQNILELGRGTIYESLSLLLLTQQDTIHELYKLYPTIIEDSDAIIEVLNYISKIGLQEKYYNILINLLRKVTWEDENTIRKVSPIIKRLGLHLPQNSFLGQYVKGLCISRKNGLRLDEVIASNPQLEYLLVLFSNGVTDINLAGLPQLKKLIVSDPKVKTVKNLEDCTVLEILDLSGTKALTTISLKGLKNLKEIYWQDSGIATIENLQECVALETLDLSNTKVLTTISLKGLKNLKEIYWQNSGVTTIENLQECVALEILDLSNTRRIQNLSLQGLGNLKELDVSSSNVGNISNLNDCKALEKLNLSYTEKLPEIVLQSLGNLRTLNLRSSQVVNLKYLNECKKLETLNLTNAYKLVQISLQGLDNLTTLDLSGVKVLTIEDLNECKKLESLDLSDTDNLQAISLEELIKLKQLNLSNTKVTVNNLDKCKALESLDLSGTDKLDAIPSETLAQLKKLTLSKVNITSTDKLVNVCKGLETLNLSNTQSLLQVSLEKLKNLKELNLSRSSVEAINNLDKYTSLEILNLSNTKKFQTISCQGLENLKKLNLSSSKIKAIDNLSTCMKLEILDLSDTEHLLDISLQGLEKLVNLKELYLAGSNIETTQQLSECKGLEILDLSNTRRLKTIVLVGLKSLRELYLSEIIVATIANLNECKSLEILVLSETENLQNISLQGLEKLKELDLSASKVVDIFNLNVCKVLEKLDLTDTTLNRSSKEAVKKFEEECQECEVVGL